MLIISRYNNSVYYIYICRIILGLRRPWFVLYIWVSTALISTQQPVISSFLYFLLQWKLAWRIIFKHCCFPLFIICTFCIFSTFKNNCKIMFTELTFFCFDAMHSVVIGVRLITWSAQRCPLTGAVYCFIQLLYLLLNQGHLRWIQHTVNLKELTKKM